MSPRRGRARLALLLLLGGCDVEDILRYPSDDGGSGWADRGVDAQLVDAAPPTGCRTDEACAAPTPRCDPEGRCVACLTHRDCPAARPVCGEGRCGSLAEGACFETLDCPVEAPECLTPEAEGLGVCVVCFDDRGCGGGTPRCHTRGDCVAANQSLRCSADGECGPGRRCADGACTFE